MQPCLLLNRSPVIIHHCVQDLQFYIGAFAWKQSARKLKIDCTHKEKRHFFCWKGQEAFCLSDQYRKLFLPFKCLSYFEKLTCNWNFFYAGLQTFSSVLNKWINNIYSFSAFNIFFVFLVLDGEINNKLTPTFKGLTASLKIWACNLAGFLLVLCPSAAHQRTLQVDGQRDHFQMTGTWVSGPGRPCERRPCDRTDRCRFNVKLKSYRVLPVVLFTEVCTTHRPQESEVEKEHRV